ncbi:hypothetical protein A0H81_11123 [Grifola frondosa]|uniref:Fungal-type protein kinase domain-containing protein n=1 Tax=Grifola frondosa TaxID=5627 RepID=A0A1C7LY34_GRIFR|nr:hypothetical protein A0H81_11123 [Grifola frondosa]
MPQDYVREAFKRSLNPERQWWRITVFQKITEDAPNAPGPSKELRRSTREQRVRPKERHFLVGEPFFRLPATPSVFDIGTRGYVAFDTQDKTLVYLKDQWRIDYDEKIEGDVIRTLNSKGVGHVPTLVCHGDIRDEDGEVQTSSNQIYWNTEENVEYYEDVPMMIHYRLVQKEVPCPLKDFGRSYDLVKIVSDCLQGHQEAVEKVGILHRDVSERNVMCIPIEKTGPDGETHTEYKGILCDWSLATDSVPPTSINDDGVVEIKKKEHRTKNQKRTRRDEDSSSISSASSTASSLRMGTWKFMSIRLSDHRMRLPTVQDDLESFFYVLLYEGVRYLSHNSPNVTLFIDENFDQHGDYGGRHVCSGGKRDMIRSNVPIHHGLYTGPLAFRHTDGERAHPLNALVTTLTSWFKAYYDICYDRIELKEHVKPMRSRDIGKYRALRGGTSDEESDTEDNIERQNQMIDKENQRSLAMMEQNRVRVVVLKNHDAMLALFRKALSRTGAWPKSDKVADQLGVKERPPL